MTDYHALVPIPGKGSINTGLSAAKPFTMLSLLGTPGRLTQECSPITNARLRSQLVTHKLNNFSVTGWRPAVEALIAAMTDVYNENRELHDVVGTEGMLCCRAVRGDKSKYSNHSYGTAIDLTINGRLDKQGATHCQKAILMLYPYFHRHKFYWGASFPTPDSMHMELSDEAVRSLYRQYYG